MDLVTRLGRSVAAAALVLAGTGAASAQEVDDLAHQIAARSAALSQVLDRLSVPETAQTLVNSAIAGDARAFNRIFDGIELPVVNKCFWISELVEKLTTSGGFVEQCWLREDLSTAEWLRYTQITVQYALTMTKGASSRTSRRMPPATPSSGPARSSTSSRRTAS